MASCIYCGKPAGFFKKKHKECIPVYEETRTAIAHLLKDMAEGTIPLVDGKAKFEAIKGRNALLPYYMNDFVARGYSMLVDKFLEDGLLSEGEEEKLADLQKSLELSQDVLNSNGAYSRVVQASILRNLMEGNELPSRLNVSGQLPFVLQKGETLQWLYRGVEVLEQRTKTVYRGGSSGVSVRIAKGVYYRTSSFRGNPVKVDHLANLGSGVLALTTKHLYYKTATKSGKIPFSKIISIDPYEDGIGIQREGVSFKPMFFKGFDGWFIYNFITNLLQ